MKKEREITVKVIENKINLNRLAEYFARKYSEKYSHKQCGINSHKK